MKLAVVYEVSVFIPGDERSRTHPGHGYGERTENYKEFHVFKDEAELISWVNYNKNRRYQLIRYEELVVEETISFKVKPAT